MSGTSINLDAEQIALNAICPYYTMFPLDFPLRHIKANKPKTVFDPFCGRGTTLYAARLLGVDSIGVDTNPVAVAISKSKTVAVSADEVVDRMRDILRNANPDPRPEGEFWKVCYADETLDGILRLRAALRSADDDVAAALRGVVMGALHGPVRKQRQSYLSNQMPRTFASKPAYSVKFWRSRGLEPPQIDVDAVIEYRIRRLFGEKAKKAKSTVILGDIREFTPQTNVDLVVTSPPYCGMKSYVPDQWLRNWFIGGADSPQYVQLDQIARGTQNEFANELGKVWARMATACREGAKLIIRFGGLESRKSDPLGIIKQSIRASDCGWKITTIRDAGDAHRGRRQASQMGTRSASSPTVAEFDIFCKLVS
jgi:hypothetical protein